MNQMLQKRKYRNTKVQFDNLVFDSKKEFKRYYELKLLEKANEIKDLKTQYEFILQPYFKKNNKSYRQITYIADFVYYDIKLDKWIVEDTKGFKTDVYKLKKKLFEYKYPNLTIKEL
jgi:hypothetical protein